MKTSLLVFSLLVNVVGVWAVWLRPTLPEIQSENNPQFRGEAADHRSDSARDSVGGRFQSDDPTRLRDRLRAAGFPPDLVNAVVVAQVRQNHQSRLRSSGLGGGDEDEYWSGYSRSSRDDLRNYLQASAEADQLLRDLLGNDYDYSASRRALLLRRLGPIASEKVDMLERIQNDYGQLMMSYRGSLFRLPGDRHELELLEVERQNDLAALLTPTELNEYELRTSDSSGRLAQTIRAFSASEDEYRQLYGLWEQDPAARQPLASFVINGSEHEAQRQKLLADAASVLTPERLADLAQALRPEATFENLAVTRLGLPLSAAKQLFEARMEVMQFTPREVAAKAQGDEAINAVTTQNTEKGRQLWTQLVETFGEKNLKNLGPGSYSDWLKKITPTATAPGG